MVCGSNYYLTGHEILCTHAINSTKLLLEHIDTLDYSSINEHRCNHCDKDLMEEQMCILDDMVTSGCQIMLSKDQELAVFYLADYVTSKHPVLSNASSPKPHHASSYLEAVSRGKLTCPSDDNLNLVLLGFYFFVTVNFNHCRKILIKVLSKGK